MFWEPQNSSLHHKGGEILLPMVAESECTKCNQYIDKQTYKNERKGMVEYHPHAKNKTFITTERVLLSQMFLECYEMIKQDYMFLPAAVFAESQHLLSDKYTKSPWTFS